AENIDNEVVLKWSTATETNNSGFEVERASSTTTPVQDWSKISFVEGRGTTTEKMDYIYKDKLTQPGTYVYRLKQIDFDGTVSYSPEVEVEVIGPKEFALFQNYPNPFNPSTTIKFALPEKTNIALSVYNSLGEKVADVFSGELGEGYHEIEFTASNLSSGIYFYRLESEKFVSVKKMIIIK
ncbi:MAG: T9SS type A sorting domain-containing protein, partial [Ignavibacteriaceae bacterium]